MPSPRRGRPPAAHKKDVVSLRLDPRLLAEWKALGPGWGSRMAERLATVPPPRQQATRPDAPPECVVLGNLVELYQGDAVAVSKKLFGSGTKISAIIADPPYGARYRSNHNSRLRSPDRPWSKYLRAENFEPIAGDDGPFDPMPWLRWAGTQPLVLWGAQYYADSLPANGRWLLWDKREGTRSNHQADCEMAWSNLPGVPRLFSHLWIGLCRRGEENLSKGGRKLHPNQKPVALMDWTLSVAGLSAGDTVLDPYMGSGSLGVACLRRGIRYIGIEIDPGYFRTAVARLQRELAAPEDPLKAPAYPPLPPPPKRRR